MAHLSASCETQYKEKIKIFVDLSKNYIKVSKTLKKFSNFLQSFSNFSCNTATVLIHKYSLFDKNFEN